VKETYLILVTTFLFTLNISSIWSETESYLPGFSWYNPRIMGMGGDVSADPDGFCAFVSNPAGFVGDKVVDEETGEVSTESEFTLVSLQAALIANPFDTAEMAGSLEESDEDFIDVFSDYLIEQLEENGMGADLDLAMASYVGQGWGFGTFISTEVYFPQSDLALSTEGDIIGDITMVVGYAHEFTLPYFDLTLGGDIRPIYRVIVPLEAETFIDGMGDYSSYTAISGFALALDGGVTLEWRDFTGALVLRDIGHTHYYMYETDLDELGNFSAGAASDTDYITPMSLTLGVGYEPVFPRFDWLVETSFVASYNHDLLLNIDSLTFYDYTESSFYSSLHFGVETKWIDILYLRAGLNEGYLTAGTGVDFFVGEFNVAIFSNETGRTAGQSSEMGLSSELAFRW
jgi:hypothetical protein